MSNAIDITARLLANENITVVRKKEARTASFDVKNRVLVIPQFKGLDPAIEELFVCHEIGHALFTDYDQMSAFFQDKSNMKYHSYFNVVEDPREEKKVKRKYPGSRKTFHEGYKKLHEMDFFNVKGEDIESRTLADRINLFYKGMSDQIIFRDPVEAEFCRRVGEVETMQEAFDLAVELYNYDKEKFQEMYEDNDHDYGDFGDDLDSDDYEDMQGNSFSEDEESKDNKQTKGEKSEDGEDSESDGEESSEEDDSENSSEEGSSDDEQGSKDDGDSDEGEADSETENDESGFDGKIQSQEDLNKKIDNFVDSDKQYIDIEFVNRKNFCPIVDYKTVLQETAYADTCSASDRYRYKRLYEGTLSEDSFVKYVNAFKAESRELISYLKKEFDLKKSAEIIKRTVVNKTGQLDMKSIYAYKIKDDIFRRNTIVKEDKNHGMIFLLDWSSSMSSVMQKTIEQVYTLASFCKVCNIPFRVFAFSSTPRTSCYQGMDRIDRGYNEDCNTMDVKDVRPYALIEFFNNSMTLQEFNLMANRLLSTKIWDNDARHSSLFSNKYGLNSTPFNSALSYMNFYLPAFKAKMNLEKVTLVTLTDGVSHDLTTCGYATYKRQYTFISPITKKRYELNDAQGFGPGASNLSTSLCETMALVKMIRDSGITVVGLNISESGYKNVRSALVSATCDSSISHERVLEAKKEDSYVVKGSFYDLGIIFPRMLKDEDDMELSDKLGEFTAKGVARQFIKQNKNRKQKRMFLDAFISTIA